MSGPPDKTTSAQIFVAIPSYRDRETQSTVRDLFERATHPERVFVGICWQLEAEDEAECFRVPYPRPAQVREVRFAAADSTGSAWARSQALSLRSGEAFVLMIDAHMRFLPGWDDSLIEDLGSVPGERTALTGWLPGFEPGQGIDIDGDGSAWRIAVRELTPVEHPSVLRLQGVRVPRLDVRRLSLTPFIVANFLFGRASMFDDVPVDPHFQMYGQEISLSARLWTHGYDVYQQRDPMLRHWWKPLDAHLADTYKHRQPAQRAKNAARVRHLLGLERSFDEGALVEIDRYGHGRVRRLDDLWRASGVDPRRGIVSAAARAGQWNEGPPRGEQVQPRIFVNVPSYRDAETRRTLADLFAKARHPERVFVGLCWQHAPGEDVAAILEDCERAPQVRVVSVPAEEARGAGWARQQAWALHRDEEYVLSIDAHTRFEPGWDEMLLDMIATCAGEKVVLTTFPTGYTGRDDCDRRGIFKTAFREFASDEPGFPPKLLYRTVRIEPTALPERPFPTATVSHNFLFARARIFDEVPIDPHIYFFGDDLAFAVRAWTSGWDFYSPHRNVLFHLWDRDARPGHWNDQPEKATRLRQLTQRRVAHLVGIEPSEVAEALVELERFGLGRARSIAAYEAFSGVDFAHRTLTERARLGDTSGAPTARRALRKLEPLASSRGAIVIDDFLDEAAYAALFEYASQVEYEYINTRGPVKRVWDLGNGFPLRSAKNLFAHAPHATTREGNFHYPSATPLDRFVEAIEDALPVVGHLVGQPSPEGWHHFSVTSWLYPPGTGLSMHDDGAGVYSGAYVYYLNPEWRPHWGGLLIVLDDEANQAIAQRKNEADGQAFHAKKWLHLSDHAELAMAHGLGRCVFPKRNRCVFIAPDAFHLVTKVQPEAGDNVRMSIAGFFHRRATARGGS